MRTHFTELRQYYAEANHLPSAFAAQALHTINEVEKGLELWESGGQKEEANFDLFLDTLSNIFAVLSISKESVGNTVIGAHMIAEVYRSGQPSDRTQVISDKELWEKFFRALGAIAATGKLMESLSLDMEAGLRDARKEYCQ